MTMSSHHPQAQKLGITDRHVPADQDAKAFAWAVFAENGNVIIWSKNRVQVESASKEYGRPIVPVIALSVERRARALEGLTRYSMWSNSTAHGMDASPTGQWVSFDELRKYLAVQSQGIQAAVDELLDMLGRVHPYAMSIKDFNRAEERLQRAVDLQQPAPVPDQAAIVWRGGLMKLIDELQHKRSVWLDWKRMRAAAEAKQPNGVGSGLEKP